MSETKDLEVPEVQDVAALKPPAKSPMLGMLGSFMKAFVSESDIRTMTSDPKIAEVIIKIRNDEL